MRLTLMMFFLIILVSSRVLAGNIDLIGPDRQALVEGRSYPISWDAEGVDSIDIVAYGSRTPLGNESRGDFMIVIADNASSGAGEVYWTVPWIDSIKFSIKAVGYNPSGVIVSDEREYAFRPFCMAGRTADGIYLDLHARDNQRLYAQKGGRIILAFLSTSSRNYLWIPPNRRLNIPHDHAGVFRVLEKIPNYWSRLYQVSMPYAMRYAGGHFIHATSEDQYGWLGQPASSGCNRLTLADARELYFMTPLGTRVEVIGPNG